MQPGPRTTTLGSTMAVNGRKSLQPLKSAINRRKQIDNVVHEDEEDNYLNIDKKQPPKSYLVKLIKGSRSNGILNLASRSLTDVPEEIFLDEIADDENRNQHSHTPDFSKQDNDREAWWNRMPLKSLDLSSNLLKTLPDSIGDLSYLVVLNLQNNQLEKIPDTIRTLLELEKLILSQNNLSVLPDGLFYISSLLTLNLSGNHLQKLSNKIGDLSYLQELDLSQNEFESFPKQIGYLTKLTKLNVSKNRLNSIPNEIGALYNLRSFEINHNQITQLPISFGDLINLEEFYCNSNRLSQFPCFAQCAKLKEIHLADNQLTQIDNVQLEPLLSLISLNIRGNKISILPEQICLLPNLERLDVTNNNLADLPSQIALNKKMKCISIIGNPLNKIRKDIMRLGTDAIMKYLRNRIADDDDNNERNKVASNNETEEEKKRRLYTEQHVVRSTGTFDFSYKNASCLQDESIQLINKEKPSHINLSKNKFSQMPVELIQLNDCLLHLDLSNNIIQNLNPEVGRLKELRYLDL
ncbi:unnamed protein product, partial [Didymodactylos carnosus]